MEGGSDGVCVGGGGGGGYLSSHSLSETTTWAVDS